jgi:hypothetical protein
MLRHPPMSISRTWVALIHLSKIEGRNRAQRRSRFLVCLPSLQYRASRVVGEDDYVVDLLVSLPKYRMIHADPLLGKLDECMSVEQ